MSLKLILLKNQHALTIFIFGYHFFRIRLLSHTSFYEIAKCCEYTRQILLDRNSGTQK